MQKKKKIMASGPITSWQMDGKQWKQWQLYFLGLQNRCRWWLQPWNEKTLAPWKKSYDNLEFSSAVQLWMTQRPMELAPRACSNSCPWRWWCHPSISSSIIPFSSCPQSFPASGSFQMSQYFASAGQSTGVSASASVLPINIQDWFPLGLTGLISL